MKYYSEDHEWIVVDGDVATIGVSEYAANELGDITYVELPAEGDDVTVGDTLGVVESVKAASDIYSPLSGAIKAINGALEDEPNLINESPEDKGWICKISNFDSSELNGMMNEDAYQDFLKEIS